MFAVPVFLGSSFDTPKYSAALLVKLKKEKARKKKGAKMKAKVQAKVHWNEDGAPQSKEAFGKWINAMVQEVEESQTRERGKPEEADKVEKEGSNPAAAAVNRWMLHNSGTLTHTKSIYSCPLCS